MTLEHAFVKFTLEDSSQDPPQLRTLVVAKNHRGGGVIAINQTIIYRILFSIMLHLLDKICYCKVVYKFNSLSTIVTFIKS